MSKRSTKFYRKNEEEVMESLGLKPTKNSGAGWVEKEDGQSEHLICQLKSTDAQSIKVNQKDIRILEYNASVAHKLPIFVIQFLNTGEVWLMAKPEDFVDVAKALNGEKPKIQENVLDVVEETQPTVKKKVKSSQSAREDFYREKEKRYKKNRSAL